MKRLILVLALIVLSVALTMAQPLAIKSGASYANSQKDTTGVYDIALYNRVSLLVTSLDSINVKVYIDTRALGATAWTIKDSVTITATAATQYDWILRNATTEKTGGSASRTRWRFAFEASDNGVTTPTYSARLYYR